MPHSWVPRPSAAKRVLGLDLSAREGYVLSRIDGTIDIDQLGQVTGLSSEEVRLIFDRLVREGAIEPPEAPSTPAEAPDGPLACRGRRPSSRQGPTIGSSSRAGFTRGSEDERQRLASVAEEPSCPRFVSTPSRPSSTACWRTPAPVSPTPA